MNALECPPFTYTDSVDFLKYWSHLLSVIAMPINLYGLFLIGFKTPLKMKNMKLTMLNAHFWASLNDIMIGTMTIPYLFIPLPAGAPLGVLTSIFGLNTFVQTFLNLGILGEVCASVVFLFENRYHQTVKEKFRINSRLFRNAFVVLNCITGSLFVSVIFMYIPEQSSAIENMKNRVPCLTPEHLTLPVTALSNCSEMIGGSLLFCMIVFSSQTGFFAIRSGFDLFFTSKKTQASLKTQQLQKKYYISLCLQIFVPFTAFVIPAACVIVSMITSYYNQTMNNIIIITVSIHGLFSTVTTMCVYEPYRTFTLGLIFCRPMTILTKTRTISDITSLKI